MKVSANKARSSFSSANIMIPIFYWNYFKILELMPLCPNKCSIIRWGRPCSKYNYKFTIYQNMKKLDSCIILSAENKVKVDVEIWLNTFLVWCISDKGWKNERIIVKTNCYLKKMTLFLLIWWVKEGHKLKERYLSWCRDMINHFSCLMHKW